MPEDTNFSYLGTWVLPEGDLCNKGDFQILEYCYDDQDELFSDFIYIKSLYGLILPMIGQLLNEHHALSWSDRSFKIYYGMWLHDYLPVIRERFRTIQIALQEELPSTFILTKNQFTVLDSLDFKEKSNEDDFNHYLYSKVIRFLDRQEYNNSFFVSKSSQQEPKFKVIKRLLKDSLKVLLLKSMQILFNIVAASSKAAVDRSYFSKKDFKNLIVSSLPRIIPIVHFPTLRYESVTQDVARRDKLQEKFVGLFSPKTDFEMFLANTLIYDMPLSFVENFKDILCESKYINLRDKHYLSSNAIFSNQILQCSVADQLSEESNLIIAQHGGSYGIVKWSMQQFYELDTADRYISFGWQSEEFNNITTISHPKLLLKSRSEKLCGRKILYITSAPSRYFNRNWSSPIPGSSMIEYYKNILALVNRIEAPLRKDLSVRIAPSSYSYKVGVDKYLGADTKLSTGNFYKEVEAASVVICDHNQTSMIETIGSNIPTILVWNAYYNKMDPVAESYFAELTRVGIFYNCHEKAAAFVNDIVAQNTVYEWWMESDRQNAIASFLSNYGIRNDSWISDYQKLLAS
jgi:putative transferase (TIGR04331 family)